MEMLVVKSVDVMVANRDPMYLWRKAKDELVSAKGRYGGVVAEEVDMWQEVIRGRSFINRHGQQVYIGMAKEAGEVLGLEFEAWEGMESRWNDERRLSSEAFKRLRKAHGQLERLHQASLWTRIKWVFTGVTDQ